MSFTYRHFLRQVPAQTIRDFLESRGVNVDERVDWQAEEPRIAQQLAEAIDALDDDRGVEIIADFERAYLLSDEHGYAALLNATPDQAGLAQRLAELENGQERALRVLVDDQDLFRAAEEIRYFDYYMRRICKAASGSRFPARSSPSQCSRALARLARRGQQSDHYFSS